MSKKKTYPKIVIDDKILNTIDWDQGVTIYHETTGTYYCGYNHFDPQPRKAKIYHKKQFLLEALDTILQDKHRIDKDRSNYKICTITVIVSDLVEA